MAAVTSKRWLVNAPVDLMLACGGLVWVLLAVHYFLAPKAFGGGPSVVDLFPLLGLVGTMLLGDTHNAASLVRLYGSKSMRTKYWYLSYLAGGAFLFLGAALAVQTAWLGPLSKIYLILIVQHVSAQAYGLAVMYCHKQNYPLGKWQGTTLRWSFGTLSLYAILCQFVFPSHFRSSFFGVNIPQWGGLPEYLLYAAALATGAAVTAFIATVAHRYAVSKELPPVAALMLLCTIAFVAATVSTASGVLSLYIPAFFHGVQYLLVSFASREDKSNAFNYISKLFLLMLALFVAAPALLTLTGMSFGTAFLVVFLTVNLHHFVADSFMWRMRDPEVKATLVPILR